MAADKKKVARGPIKDRVFFMLYRGALEGEPVITFDKMVALETVLEANSKGDTTLKMAKMVVPRGSRKKAPAGTGGPVPA